jgi:protein-S-isoprenylcysteine O-methyltransferase Ste14
MQRDLAALTIILLTGMVLTRAFVMKRHGTTALHFGQIDKKDFIIPPFALFYIYIVFAAAFGLALPSTQEFFHSQAVSWIGILLCIAGLALLLWSIVSFGQSFRVGIDTSVPDKLITTGAFAISRNPIYVALAFIMIGIFLTFSNWILFAYLIAAVAVQPSGLARGNIYESPLWAAVRGVLSSGTAIFASSALPSSII